MDEVGRDEGRCLGEKKEKKLSPRVMEIDTPSTLLVSHRTADSIIQNVAELEATPQRLFLTIMTSVASPTT